VHGIGTARTARASCGDDQHRLGSAALPTSNVASKAIPADGMGATLEGFGCRISPLASEPSVVTDVLPEGARGAHP